jgi:hypothetical protein
VDVLSIVCPKTSTDAGGSNQRGTFYFAHDSSIKPARRLHKQGGPPRRQERQVRSRRANRRQRRRRRASAPLSPLPSVHLLGPWCHWRLVCQCLWNGIGSRLYPGPTVVADSRRSAQVFDMAVPRGHYGAGGVTRSAVAFRHDALGRRVGVSTARRLGLEFSLRNPGQWRQQGRKQRCPVWTCEFSLDRARLLYSGIRRVEQMWATTRSQTMTA